MAETVAILWQVLNACSSFFSWFETFLKNKLLLFLLPLVNPLRNTFAVFLLKGGSIVFPSSHSKNQSQENLPLIGKQKQG